MRELVKSIGFAMAFIVGTVMAMIFAVLVVSVGTSYVLWPILEWLYSR